MNDDGQFRIDEHAPLVISGCQVNGESLVTIINIDPEATIVVVDGEPIRDRFYFPRGATPEPKV